MQYKTLRKIANYIFITSLVLTVFFAIMCVANGGILNDLDFALEEMQALEKDVLLNSPPESISRITKREIELAHNSAGLRQYIIETESFGDSVIMTTIAFFALSVVAFIAKIYFVRKLRDNK